MICKRSVIKAVLAFAALKLGPLGLVHWRARARERRAEAAHPAQGTMVQVGKTRIHAVVEGSGPDVVLIHGASTNAQVFVPDFSSLMAQRYRVITLDRPGFGWSSPLPENADTLADQARVLQAAAAQLGARRPIVVGHSYGAAVALAWAVHMPDTLSALVPVGGVAMTWPGPVARLYRVLGSTLGAALVVPLMTAFVTDKFIARAIEGVFAPLPAPPGFAHSSAAALSIRRRTLRINARQRLRLKSEVGALMPHYPNIHHPVEILHGDTDGTTPLAVHAEPLSRALPNAKLTVLTGVGHMPFHLDPQPLVHAIDRAATRANLPGSKTL